MALSKKHHANFRIRYLKNLLLAKVKIFWTNETFWKRENEKWLFQKWAEIKTLDSFTRYPVKCYSICLNVVAAEPDLHLWHHGISNYCTAVKKPAGWQLLVEGSANWSIPALVLDIECCYFSCPLHGVWKKERGPRAKRKEEMEWTWLQHITNAACQCTVCFLVGRRRCGALFGTLIPLCTVHWATDENSSVLL